MGSDEVILIWTKILRHLMVYIHVLMIAEGSEKMLGDDRKKDFH